MRIKVRFASETPQPAIVVDLRFMPRVGERLEIGFRKTVEILVASRFDDDKKYDGFVKVRCLTAPTTAQAAITGVGAANPMATERRTPPVVSTTRQAPLSGVQGVGQSFGDLSVHELGRIARDLDKPRPGTSEPLAPLSDTAFMRNPGSDTTTFTSAPAAA